MTTRTKSFSSLLAGTLIIGLVLFSGFSGLKQGGSLREFQKGVAFTGYTRDAYVGWQAETSLQNLKKTNARWVSLLVTAYQDNINSTVIDYNSAYTPNDDSVRHMINYAHQLGLKVMLKPHVDLLNDPHHWRGQIGLHFNEAAWGQWFSSYRQFILHYAQIAAETGTEQFCVGCELDATVARAQDWRQVIAAIREVFPGTLVYADDQVESKPEAVTFWDALDLIGQDLYPVLTSKTNPSVSDLCYGWKRLLNRIKELSERWGKPVLITEIGYRSVQGAAQRPWDWQKEGPVDLVVQRKCYEAALRMVAGRPYLAGMYWWQWFPDLDIGGPNDTSFSPFRKPAEKVLRLRYLLPM
ncbi:MAG: hypothetical protein QHH44_10025 [Candidatus Saccharicenans sp.]|jgi:hypothetical protein|nr:hypothetical protein [Candidatus Saccharicenans sp.]